ncbi:hypothetical protein [Desulfobacter sp.]
MIKKGIVRAKQCGGFVPAGSYYPAAGDFGTTEKPAKKRKRSINPLFSKEICASKND